MATSRKRKRATRRGVARDAAGTQTDFELDLEPASPNVLYYGDNLEVLPEIRKASVDLVYLDPPFNSKQDYNQFFLDPSGRRSSAQRRAFEDTWRWTPSAAEAFELGVAEGGEVAERLYAFKRFLKKQDMMAYLAMMAPRLIKLRRVLKPTGSIVLHCDPGASHYLKVLMDAVFGARCFRNEIIWHYSGWNKRLAHHFERRHDVLLFYALGDAQRFNGYGIPWESQEEYLKVRKQKLRHDEHGDYVLSDAGGGKRIKRYVADAMLEGRPVDDVWEIDKLNNSSKERLGYPTQKPFALLERIIRACSDEGDTVLDPFCGCGTAIDAAQALGRTWIGIDIAYLAIDVIETRLHDRYGSTISDSYGVAGKPKDLAGACALWEKNRFDFETWAVTRLKAQANDKQVGDEGVDGRLRFDLPEGEFGLGIVSVKGGENIGPAMVRELHGTLTAEDAQLGVLILMREPTPGMTRAADAAGTYSWPMTGQPFPKIQVVTVEQLLQNERPGLPPVYLPYLQAQRAPIDHVQLDLPAEKPLARPGQQL